MLNEHVATCASVVSHETMSIDLLIDVLSDVEDKLGNVLSVYTTAPMKKGL